MDLTEILRPRTFDAVFGQSDTKELIRANLKSKRFPKISLFTGDTGTGKSTLAEIVGLSLACENPKSDGTACLRCSTCIENIHSLEVGHSTTSMVKVNMGLASSKQDIKDLIKDIFILQSRPEGNSVYILEEMHALRNKQDQIPLLEEFMHVPEGVYILMCTTEKYKLLPELRGRACEFSLARPTEEECYQLIDQVCLRIKIATPNKATCKWLTRQCKHTPREIVKTIDILSKGGKIDEKQARKYLGEVSQDYFIEYFKICTAKEFSMSKLINWLDNLDINKVDFIRGVRQFVMDVAICIWGENADSVAPKTKASLKEIFSGYTEEQYLNFMEYVRDLNKVTDEDSASFELFSLCQRIRGRDGKLAAKEGRRIAKTETLRGDRNSIIRRKEETNKSLASDNKQLEEEEILELLGSSVAYTRQGIGEEHKEQEESTIDFEDLESAMGEGDDIEVDFNTISE